MTTFRFTNIAGEKAVCSCSQYDGCSMECILYRKYTGKQTNYDRIISKTPEELAEWIVKIKYPYRGDGKDYEIALGWLKSPVEVEE